MCFHVNMHAYVLCFGVLVASLHLCVTETGWQALVMCMRDCVYMVMCGFVCSMRDVYR